MTLQGLFSEEKTVEIIMRRNLKQERTNRTFFFDYCVKLPDLIRFWSRERRNLLNDRGPAMIG